MAVRLGALSTACELLTKLGTDISEEKDKFIDDAMRLAEDISGNQTFYTVKPLLNFWAAFTPSKEVRILHSRVSDFHSV